MVNGVITLKDSYKKIPIDESFRLIAGPGAGKTTFLVNHIKHVLNESNKLKNGSKILCITYTNVAVNTIKEKFRNNVNDIEISTIHHFLFKHVLKPYIWILKDELNPNLLDLTKIKISFPSFSVLPKNATINLFSRGFSRHEIYSQLRRFYWDFDDSANIKPICRGRIPFTEDYLLRYKQKQWNSQKITFSDILRFSYEILKKEPLIMDILRIKFPYIFIDEFQDVCNIQKKIFELLCGCNVVCGIIGDPAQSIYSFRGATYGNIQDFKLNLKEYNLLINRRCDEKIVNVLNNLRDDGIIQVPLGKKTNYLPTLLIGTDFEAYNYVNNLNCGNFNVLAYKHKYLNDLNFKILSEDFDDNRYYLKKFWKFEDNPRKLIIEYTIKAIESFRDYEIQDALRYLTFAFHYFENNKENLIKKLFEFSQDYHKFKGMTLADFYMEYIYIAEVPVLKKILGGDPKEIYNNISYLDLAKDIKQSNNSLFRTIHSCKGEEFDNVLILTGDSRINFLFDFNINVITHRVFYVALSRARKNLFITVPDLNKSKYSLINDNGFDIVYLSD